ncbi:copper amine oxidase N-terminal domain-containing protein [Brevibacillus ruminantium]|uniref:Copper amine oxidase N-terminal domain-containing protein n=1 Tax=Brevibacillus ruminantium TaxID=2950604 RepID=A0ABY4WGZ1_9BACL|nr:copper amine oxidase N-terminal domain-containing protein [Brevibacillus ruminantium]USG65110.1 copper amine oxidase N-terminal domain-containing protein [Brevibacillus ruminantium]
MKKTIGIILICLLISNLPNTSLSAEKEQITIVLDGEALKLDVNPILEKGSILVPIREIFQRMGARVSFDPSTQKIVIEQSDSKIELWIGNNNAYVNQKLFNLDVPPSIVNGRTLVPLRFIIECLGYHIEWNQTNKTVNISTNGSLTQALNSAQAVNSVPSNVLLSIIHQKPNPYWTWTKVDQDYLQNFGTNLTENQKDILLKEMLVIQDEVEKWETHYTKVKGMKFYPSYTVGIIDTLNRAIKARYLLVYESNNYKYVSDGQSGIVGNEVMYGNFIERDLNASDQKILHAIQQVPFDTKIYEGLRILNVPIDSLQGLNSEFYAAGYASRSTATISIVTGINNADNTGTFYHELGHIWDGLYHDEKKYLSIRQKQRLDDSSWGSSLDENFAEDFRLAMSPNKDQMPSLTAFGQPDEEVLSSLREWILDTTENNPKILPFVEIDNEQRFSYLYATNEDSITFSGTAQDDFTMTIITPNGDREEQEVSTKNNHFRAKVSLQQEGVYQIRSAIGSFTIVYLKYGK